MTRSCSSSSNSSFVSSFSSWLLFVSVALLTGITVCTLTTETSFWLSLSSTWTWSSAFHVFPSSPSSSSSKRDESLAGEEALPNSSSDNGFLPSVIPKQTDLLPLSSKKHEASEDLAMRGSEVGVKRYSKLMRLEAGLARARASIRMASAQSRNQTSTHDDDDPDYVPRGPIYRNAFVFHRSYLEMEKIFKIFVYEEGDPPLFHNGPCRSIYSTEGRFINEMEKAGNHYRTRDPDEAHVYFLPFSVVMMVQFLYVPDSHEIDSIGRTVVDYINILSAKYPYWNRSLGADHFMLSCHDWGPRTSAYVRELFDNSIRVLCNANTSEGFNPLKDASFPEIHLRTGEITGLLGGLSPSRRPLLAFFAGRLHGNIRLLLLQEWKDRDKDVQVYDELPDGMSYNEMLKKSKYCLCPSGYEVASPRIVEAIYAECVPVLISDHYVPPFSDVLNWNSFSVQIAVSDIPNIKTILSSISQTQYIRMQRRVKQVQRHFVVNGPPQRFDVFHMILHSIWLRRLNIHIRD
ncbi:PREDICTED: probable glycosyltransferase At3g07620 [Nelumbo nucifera]|uniref:Probable glycosyltransferase At3g07620 n=1 Tax=Nelumbo nucifera TaxID=4432 RepID=A0A1U7ZGI3_NELNU|nr:PREDICTED: probable glycosyltransferase At3g07620 [Nelumbo nucifera]